MEILEGKFKEGDTIVVDMAAGQDRLAFQKK